MSQHRPKSLGFLLLIGLAFGCAQVRVYRSPVPTKASIAAQSVVAGRVTRDEIETLEAEVATQPTGERLVILAALHAKLAKRALPHDRPRAIAHYRSAAVYASFAIGDPNYDSVAIALHNESVAGCVRSLRTLVNTTSDRKEWALRLHQNGIEASGTVLELSPSRVDDLLVCDDLVVRGMNHHYRAAGVGCPLVAYRKVDEQLDLQDKFYPDVLNSPATGVISADGSPLGGDWRSKPVRLVLHDPLRESSVEVAGQKWPLAYDLTTPVAREQSIRARALARIDRLGLIDPQLAAKSAGLFMLTPYQPEKIPVVMIHGMGSGPETWTQVYNDIQGDPVLRSKYQLWLVRYPTGNAVLYSSLQVRKEFDKTRNAFDPFRINPTFDQMVVMGHSLGGLMTKSMVIESGDELWNAAFTLPMSEVRASPETHAMIRETFTLRPHTEIKRVVFVATPHQGSRLANIGLFQFLAQKIIRQPDQFAEVRKELVALNGPNVFKRGMVAQSLNVIEGVTFGNPVIEAMSRLPVAPHVRAHSIIANVRKNAPLREGTDLVVAYESAHIEEVVSEHIVPGNHFCLDRPHASAEIQRILHEHLAESVNPAANPSRP